MQNFINNESSKKEALIKRFNSLSLKYIKLKNDIEKIEIENKNLKEKIKIFELWIDEMPLIK